MSGWIVLAVVVVVLVLIVGSLIDGDEDFAARKAIDKTPGLEGSLVYRHRGSKRAIAMARDGSMLGYFEKDTSVLLAASQILAVEVVEDGTTVLRTSGSKLGRAAVGGIVLGPVGAILGALSVNQVTMEKVSKIHLRITRDDVDQPFLDVPFLQEIFPIDRSIAESKLELARQWHARISSLMKRDTAPVASPLSASSLPE